LPAYSPDLNPTEKVFEKSKRFLQQMGARTREAVVEAMSKAIDVIIAKNAQGFFAHCGYRRLYRCRD
jgi:hypothetical protein